MIDLHHLRKRFGAFTAVDDVSLTIRPGEFLTLLGPSGCGKTTLLRMISGFETPDSGQVLLQGKDLVGIPPYRRDVNQVFQSYALFPHLNVRQNIAFGLNLRRLPRKTIDEKVARAVEMVSLTGMENRWPAQLSGGQKQRVALARALVCQPKVLLLDEPLAALDAKLRRSMQLELKRLQNQLGITFVLVTHDQDEAITMSDRIAVMNTGKIEQVGTPPQIYNHPETAFAATFLGQTNLLPATVVTADAEITRVQLGQDTLLHCPASGFAGGDAVWVSIRPEQLELRPHTETAPNALPGVITERIFKGAFEQLLIRTGDGVDLTVVTASIPRDFPAGIGDPVNCLVKATALLARKDSAGPSR